MTIQELQQIMSDFCKEHENDANFAMFSVIGHTDADGDGATANIAHGPGYNIVQCIVSYCDYDSKIGRLITMAGDMHNHNLQRNNNGNTEDSSDKD